MRDPQTAPLTDPQPGDVVHKQLRSNKWSERKVTRREGNDIYYTTREGGPENNCWISTWMEWCRTAEVKVSYI